ncbi:DUF402 domain-containing protein [Actinacidiphila yeochonensis]|uniref:DUF402 domain-containing protein n=1 Tax=Actinacidiphila yeochonensis TaxID=89050 RepID=UPI0006897902|nr:DUF402 domain-containing protein [Actinacidiphila yeochonensis]
MPLATPGGSAPLLPGTPVLVRLVKAGREKVGYDAEVVADDGGRVTVTAPWSLPEARDFGFTVFAPGDVFTEHYWRDRWYAVKEVRTAGGELKGWYCDVTRPVVVDGGVLVSEDLDLDLWVSADGTDVRRLDEDEFAASGLSARDPEAAGNAVRALDALERAALGAGGLEQLTR